jgi:hypothetical protein
MVQMTAEEASDKTTTEMAATCVECSVDSAIGTVVNKPNSIFSLKEEQTTSLKALVEQACCLLKMSLFLSSASPVLLLSLDEAYPIMSRGILICPGRGHPFEIGNERRCYRLMAVCNSSGDAKLGAKH